MSDMDLSLLATRKGRLAARTQDIEGGVIAAITSEVIA